MLRRDYHGSTYVDPNTGQGLDFAKIFDPAGAVYTQFRPGLTIEAGVGINEYAVLGEQNAGGGAQFFNYGAESGGVRFGGQIMPSAGCTGHAGESWGLMFGALDDPSAFAQGGGSNTSACIRIGGSFYTALPRDIGVDGELGPFWEVGWTVGDGSGEEVCVSIGARDRYGNATPPELLPVAGQVRRIEVFWSGDPSREPEFSVNGHRFFLGNYFTRFDPTDRARFLGAAPDYTLYGSAVGLAAYVLTGDDPAANAFCAFASTYVER